MKICPILKVECDSDAPCCEKCTLYIEHQNKSGEKINDKKL